MPNGKLAPQYCLYGIPGKRFECKNFEDKQQLAKILP